MKKKIWYEYCPGVVFKAVILKTRKTWLLGTQHLVIYRNDIYNYCVKLWTDESQLIERHLIEEGCIR